MEGAVARALRLERLLQASRTLYEAGRWTCEGMPAAQQALLWEALRDAAAIPRGTATALGNGAKL